MYKSLLETEKGKDVTLRLPADSRFPVAGMRYPGDGTENIGWIEVGVPGVEPFILAHYTLDELAWALLVYSFVVENAEIYEAAARRVWKILAACKSPLC